MMADRSEAARLTVGIAEPGQCRSMLSWSRMVSSRPDLPPPALAQYRRGSSKPGK